MPSLTKGFRKRKAEPEMRRRMRWQEHIAKLRQAGYEPCPPKLAVIINEDHGEGQDDGQE